MMRLTTDAAPSAAHSPGETRWRVCVPITAFPVAGGMRGVLAGVAQVMADDWHLEYLTRHRGADSGDLTIRQFGGVAATPWQFPNVWLYAFTGWRALRALLRHGAAAEGYRLVLPQDGVFTGAFAAIAARLCGVRVICMDHGSITLPYSATYRAERLRGLATQPWPRRAVERLRYAMYWPSLRLLARLATRYTDLFLVAGDEVEEVYRTRLGVSPNRILRYPYMVDSSRYQPLAAAARDALRTQRGLAADAIVVTMINRLAPEKGMDVALRGTRRALAALPADMRARVRLLIAGDGPLRQEVAAEAQRLGLGVCVTLCGEARPDDVLALLQLSDIFLYAGTRGTNYSMAVLEAMATGCAVVATTEPRSNAHLLAEGRGLAIAPGDDEALAGALGQLMRSTAARRAMGRLAREYVAVHHSAEALRASLLRAATTVVGCLPQREVARDASR